ncbi:uncharacterized protein LOC128661248 [Bombina bombina]|uniref:uncharacterized protein LOC128661248 n=1 Tax=Bombina bombina TaxID=8345 RepID=UPI00235AB376|nr:uncharacterized protein LOC128661248 [Bombina bombina]
MRYKRGFTGMRTDEHVRVGGTAVMCETEKAGNERVGGGCEKTDLLHLINSLMQDEEINLTRLNEELSLLDQLSEIIKYPDIRSSAYFSNLSSVVYFGISSVFQSILSPCSETVLSPQQRQSLSISALDILHSLQIFTLSSQSVHEQEMSVKTPMFNLQIKSVNCSNLGHMVLSFPEKTQEKVPHVIFPIQSSLQSVVQQYFNVNIQMMSFSQSPFISTSALNVTGVVAGLSLYSGVQELNVQNLSDNFQVCVLYHMLPVLAFNLF